MTTPNEAARRRLPLVPGGFRDARGLRAAAGVARHGSGGDPVRAHRSRRQHLCAQPSSMRRKPSCRARTRPGRKATDRDEAAHRAAAGDPTGRDRPGAVPRRARAQAQIADLGDQREKVMRQSAEQQVQTLQQQLADMQARQTDRGIVLTVGDVLFDTGQATLQAGCRQRDRAAGQLPARRIRIARSASRAIPTARARWRPTWSCRSAGPTPLPTRWPPPASRARGSSPSASARTRRWPPTRRRPAGSRTAASRW